MIGKRAVGRCFLMSGLPQVLKDVANTKFSERRVASAYGAPATSPRPSGFAGNTGCTIEVTELCNAFWEQPLSPVFLNHEQQKAVI